MAEQEKLSVAIAAGGTAGHINPALALAEELSAAIRLRLRSAQQTVHWCLRRDLSWYLSM